MLEFIIAIAIFILSALLSIVSAKTPLYSVKKKLKIYKSGWQALGLMIAIVLLFGGQNYLNNIEVEKAKKTAAQENKKSEDRITSTYAKSIETITKNYDAKTSELKAAYDASTFTLKDKYDSSSKDIIKALARYGLKYDAAQQKIEKTIRDSLKTGPEPVLTLDPEDKISVYKNDTFEYTFKVNLLSRDAGSTGFKLNVAIYASTFLSGPYKLMGKPIMVFSQSTKFAANDGQGIYVGATKIRAYVLYFFRIYGTYKNLKDNHEIPIDNVYVYNFLTTSVAPVVGNAELKIKSIPLP